MRPVSGRCRSAGPCSWCPAPHWPHFGTGSVCLCARVHLARFCTLGSKPTIADTRRLHTARNCPQLPPRWSDRKQKRGTRADLGARRDLLLCGEPLDPWLVEAGKRSTTRADPREHDAAHTASSQLHRLAHGAADTLARSTASCALFLFHFWGVGTVVGFACNPISSPREPHAPPKARRALHNARH